MKETGWLYNSYLELVKRSAMYADSYKHLPAKDAKRQLGATV